MRISVSAGEPGDLNGTRAGDDVNADEQEFMHTLRLYIVNDNDNGVRRTVLDLSPDLTNNTLAQTGNLTNYETGELTLAPGTYAYGPAGLPHRASCTSPEPCPLFIAFEGPVDVLPHEGDIG